MELEEALANIYKCYRLFLFRVEIELVFSYSIRVFDAWLLLRFHFRMRLVSLHSNSHFNLGVSNIVKLGSRLGSRLAGGMSIESWTKILGIVMLVVLPFQKWHNGSSPLESLFAPLSTIRHPMFFNCNVMWSIADVSYMLIC